METKSNSGVFGGGSGFVNAGGVGLIKARVSFPECLRDLPPIQIDELKVTIDEFKKYRYECDPSDTKLPYTEDDLPISDRMLIYTLRIANKQIMIGDC